MELDWDHMGLLAIDSRLSSRQLMNVKGVNWDGYQCVVEWLFAKAKRNNGALSIDIADSGVGNDCRGVPIGALSELPLATSQLERMMDSCKTR